MIDQRDFTKLNLSNLYRGYEHCLSSLLPWKYASCAIQNTENGIRNDIHKIWMWKKKIYVSLSGKFKRNASITAIKNLTNTARVHAYNKIHEHSFFNVLWRELQGRGMGNIWKGIRINSGKDRSWRGVARGKGSRYERNNAGGKNVELP